jgi:tRNA G18 (ribose-2'-O)-methylase SpoU
VRKLKHSEIERLSLAELARCVRHPVTVVIENVRSAYNVGSMVRTCDAALAERLIVTGYTPPPDHSKVRKTALGAELGVPWESAPETIPVIEQLKRDGYTIAVLEITDSPTPVSKLENRHFPLALIVGNEVSGVTDAVIAESDLAIEIPQFGLKQSLNVAVALGIGLFGAVERFRSIRPTRP